MSHKARVPVCEHTKPSGINIPNRLWEHATAEEAAYISQIHKKRCRLRAKMAVMRLDGKDWQTIRPLSQEDYRLSADINGFRQTLRHRRSQSFTDGMYTVTRKSCYARIPEGRYGINDYQRCKKGDILLFSHVDELGRVFFVTSDSKMVAFKGCEVDGISRVASFED